ncbi:MAG: UDP-N-acetylmuramoyl-tripeptide--D-alanyl-D-alanine ligase [Methylococcales bacterium]|nr:UDP-N-acetylmuramoyl-tripeptide--D-alanyl-D-alanine ligase [Methylococcales bacterium]
MRLRLSTIAAALAQPVPKHDLLIDGVSTDTRTLQPGQLFVALKGPNFDGHEFCDQALKRGAAALLVSQAVATPLPQLVVTDTRLALGEMAGYWRRQLTLKVVGITGSNGKTTVKEMTAAILQTQGKVGFTQGNLNNDIGVPLTLLRLSEQEDFGVIEMGANHLGEIDYSSHYAQPDAAVITSIGPAHLEGFGSLANTARAKGEIYHHLSEQGVAVMPYDTPYRKTWQALLHGQRVITFGLDAQADVRACNLVDAAGLGVTFDLTYRDEKQPVRINLAGQHNIVNALAASALALAFAVALPDIARGLATVRPAPGRLQFKPGYRGCLLLDDSYNANPASVMAGAHALLKVGREPWVILGALAELGPDSEALHERLGRSLRDLGILRLWATGAQAAAAVRGFGDNSQYFAGQLELITALKQHLNGREALLIKGSRSQRMENIVAALTAEETE